MASFRGKSDEYVESKSAFSADAWWYQALSLIYFYYFLNRHFDPLICYVYVTNCVKSWEI